MNFELKSLIRCSVMTVLVAVSSVTPYAEAADWKPYGNAKYIDYEYDAESVAQQEEGIVRVWSKDTIKDNEGSAYIKKERQKRELSVEGYDKYLYTTHYIEFNCASRQNRLLAMYDYNSDGVTLYSDEFSHSEWVNTVPGSQADQLLKIVCAAR